jgi:parallel beta-helix repeat protein
VAFFVPAAHAATLCVQAGGKNGCYSTIGAAVGAANAGDTVNVASGTYAEGVVIGKSIALLGAGARSTVIDATGHNNGVYIDGLDNSGLAAVIVSGFTVENAKFEGVLLTNASNVTIRDNLVTGNNKAIVTSSSGPPTCPGIPSFETEEGMDCGEGLHLSGVDHSIVDGNNVTGNAGGILVTDDTGPTFQNLISGNAVVKNPLDCGITIASHPAFNGQPAAFGVYQNTIRGNDSEENGLAAAGGGGVGLFAPGPGNAVYSNVVVGNRLVGNGLPGVLMHNHFSTSAAPANLSGNLIVGNFIAKNHADTLDAATTGPTGINVFGFGAITGTVIAQNVISDEDIDIATNTPAEVLAHLNNLTGNGVGIDNIGQGTVNATLNWWGCPAGPGHGGCSTVEGQGVTVLPVLQKPVVPAGAGVQ